MSGAMRARWRAVWWIWAERVGERGRDCDCNCECGGMRMLMRGGGVSCLMRFSAGGSSHVNATCAVQSLSPLSPCERERLSGMAEK